MTRVRLGAIVLAVVVLGAAAVVAFADTGRGGGPPRSPAGRRLVFDDEFNGSRLDRHHWSTCYWWASTGCTNGHTGELEWYQPGQVMVAHGTLRLTAARRTIRGAGETHDFVSGMISSGPTPARSKPRFAFRYGRVEARIKVPAGRGLWPTFWLLPTNKSPLPEVDIMEMVGQNPEQQHMHLHYRRDGREFDVGTIRRLRPTPGGWHVFGIDWEPGRLTWMVDDRVLFRVAGSGVPRVPMYILADLAVGGEEPGPPDAATPFPSSMQIDWLRVWR